MHCHLRRPLGDGTLSREAKGVWGSNPTFLQVRTIFWYYMNLELSYLKKLLSAGSQNIFILVLLAYTAH